MSFSRTNSKKEWFCLHRAKIRMKVPYYWIFWERIFWGSVFFFLPFVEWYFYDINENSNISLKLIWILFSLIFFGCAYITLKAPIRYLIHCRSILNAGKELWSLTYSKRNFGLRIEPSVYEKINIGIDLRASLFPIFLLIIGFFLFYVSFRHAPLVLSFAVLTTVLGYKLLSDRIKKLY